jgi:hypothetical protein
LPAAIKWSEPTPARARRASIKIMEENTGEFDEIKEIADKFFELRENAQADVQALHDYLNEQPTARLGSSAPSPHCFGL